MSLFICFYKILHKVEIRLNKGEDKLIAETQHLDFFIKVLRS